MVEILKVLCAKLPEGRIKLKEPMASHTTFKVGGPADIFVTPENPEELAHVLKACRDGAVPYFVLGNGSNLLVKDGGVRGVVISLVSTCDVRLLTENTLYAQAGALLPQVSKFALAHSLSGFEFAEGIPGSVGGAVCMNAGAYDSEIGDIFHSAQIIDGDGRLFEISAADMAFSYRKSAAQKEGWVVVSATFKLSPGDKSAIAAKMVHLKEQRTTKQPLNLPSAGSTFKRPPGKFAGKLIMDAGLRGYAIGGAQVSEKHCGFVVNTGGATAADILTLMDHVQCTVQEKFGIWLEPEVRIIGE
ncbi:MAG: UDP-N-acetylmuramate dehydrogenase [Defluviitaleaceae bacterium]|nr:UDP-N-acetylmuramate dehydrogenase [Defluviitaleaceae bacterium]